MVEDDIFRRAFVLLCLVFMPLGLYHRIRAHTGETIDRWQEGILIFFGLRLTALVLLASTLAWLMVPASMAWAALPLSSGGRWMGVLIAFAAGVLWVLAVHALGPNLTDTVVIRQRHMLVTSGPYRWVRHPFYTACFIALAGVGLLMANWCPLVLGVIGALFLIARTRIEEGKLEERFGEEYRRYQAATGKFLPRMGS